MLLPVQVLNLFLALLLSSFGAESLKHSQEDSEPNKLQEAVDRINRFAVYVRSMAMQLVRDCRASNQPITTSHDSFNCHHGDNHRHHGRGDNNNVISANRVGFNAVDTRGATTLEHSKVSMVNEVTVGEENWSQCPMLNGRSNNVNYNLMSAQNNHGGWSSVGEGGSGCGCYHTIDACT